MYSGYHKCKKNETASHNERRVTRFTRYFFFFVVLDSSTFKAASLSSQALVMASLLAQPPILSATNIDNVLRLPIFGARCGNSRFIRSARRTFFFWLLLSLLVSASSSPETELVSSLRQVSQCPLQPNEDLNLTNEFDASASTIGGGGGGGIAILCQSDQH